jgi:hypothetical protein
MKHEAELISHAPLEPKEGQSNDAQMDQPPVEMNELVLKLMIHLGFGPAHPR